MTYPMQRLLAGFAAAALVCSAVSTAVAETSESSNELPETPAEYEAYALEQESELEALYERWRAANSKAAAAGANWSQPRLGYRAFIDAWWLDDAAITHIGTLSQTFPWPGVLEEATAPARKQAEAVRHRFEARVLQTVFEVRSQLIGIARIDATRAILDEQVEVYDDVRSLIEQAMESDRADYGDLLRVSTAREKLVDRLDTLESRRKQRIADLRELLTLEPGVELTFDFEGNHDPLAVEETVPERTKLVKLAREQHPALAAERAEAEGRLERAEYARSKRLPSPTVSLGIRSMPDHMGTSGYDRRTALIVGLSLPLPIFGAQYDYNYRRFEHEHVAELAERTETRSELVAGIDASVARIEEKVRRLERYREELLPLAEDATENMRQKIETGERSVTDYLLSFEQELDLKTNLVEFRAAIATERARLERLTGGEYRAFRNRESADIDIDDANQAETNDE